jgi:CubicO group peptidase (beta-lactamase class C family)
MQVHRFRLRASSLLSSIAVLLAAGCGGADSISGYVAPLDGHATSIAEFQTRLETLRLSLQIPGMGAAIAQNGRVAWERGFGMADPSLDAPVSPTTSFHIASLTKTFATTVILRLVDSGLVALDDPVSKYGINLSSGGVVRVRHLLSMTSGGSVPGDTFTYDGDRFALLDQVVLQASGRSFADLANAWIIAPLGLTHTAPNVDNPTAFAFTGMDPVAFRRNLAVPYTLSGGSAQPSKYPTSFSVAAGMISTAGEVARFSIALDSAKVLRAAMRDLMFTPILSSGGATLPYALGWFSQTYNGVRVVWAYGLWVANSALIIKVPERGLTFVVLANTEQLSARYNLGGGKLLESPLAQEFLNAFVFNSTPLP